MKASIAVEPEVIPMDEPCSIATAGIEGSIEELKENYIMVIVTHSMRRAARVSRNAAFIHLGELVWWKTAIPSGYSRGPGPNGPGPMSPGASADRKHRKKGRVG